MWARISRSIARWYFFRFVHWFWLCMCSGISKSCENPTSNTLWTAVTVTIGYSDTDTSYGVKYAVECVKAKGSSSHFPIPNKSFIAVWCTRRQKTSSKECLTNLVWLIQICIFHSFLSYSLKKKNQWHSEGKMSQPQCPCGKSQSWVQSPLPCRSRGDSVVLRKTRKQGDQPSQKSASLQLCVSSWPEPLLVLVSEV